ncbi:MAG: CGNR zinc finger domain-containing protein [Thermoanaerobaculia bacterium]|nr:CGNR zinc finger domain-containing protein [Thermoanaerobaculia bacterium]
MDATSALATPAFELSGGALALDFSNSWGDRSRPESDRLTEFGSLAAFCWQAKLLPTDEAAPWLAAAAGRPAAASATLVAARELRDALFTLFAAAARRRTPTAQRTEPTAALAILNGWLARALPDRELAPGDAGYVWRWRGAPAALDPLAAPLRPIALAAADLLASDQLDRVRECAAPNCSWLFLDRSRAASRRWCSMESCGNRAKARRHYRRRAAGAS